MLTKKDIISILDSYAIKPGIPRPKYVDVISKYMERRELLILKGIRRCGKSTILKQLITKIGQDKCVYVNFDDYRFLEHKSVKLLERIFEIYATKEYFFFDEIQNVPNFESWLRTQYERDIDAKFIISGSNSNLMTKELGTLLTGRSISFEIMPLTYKEFREFTDGDLKEYLTFGGFPEVVLESDLERKRGILQNYFDTIVEKDIIQKNDLSMHKQLKEMLKYIILNPGIRISANKLAKQLGISINTVKSYLSLTEEVFLLFEVPFFSHSAKTKYVNTRVSKYYCIDLGFSHLFATRFEKGKLYENIVALSFFPQREELYYWADKNEVDFVHKDTAINVVASDKIPDREYLGLKEIEKNKKNIQKLLLITPSSTQNEPVIHVPLESFLLKQ